MSRTRAAAAHLDRVAGLGCILCRDRLRGYVPAEIHHLREDQGAAQRGSDWLAVPLCPDHHRGANGLHGLGRRGFERMYKLSELDLLAMTMEALAEGKIA